MISLRQLFGFTVLNAENLRTSLSLSACRNLKRWVAPTLRELKRRKDKLGPQPLQHRSTFLDWNYHAELYAFGKRLNEEFQGGLLQNALTHRSYIAQEEAHQRELGIEEPKLALEDNSELAHEGGELMSDYIKRYLRVSLPRVPEEGIRCVHDWLVSDAVLANVSSHIGTKDLILCSEMPAGEATLATALRAVVGALARGSRQERAQLFVRDLVLTQLAGRDLVDIWRVADPMATLRDILEREGRGEPEPRLIREAGRNTILAAFQVGVYSDKQHIGTGSGEDVYVATEMAAEDALRRIFNIADNMKPIAFKLDFPSETRRNASLREWSQSAVQP